MKENCSQRGSISIEATISLVIFTFFMISVLLFINISRTQMRIQAAADKAVKEITGYLYLYKITGLYDLDMSIQNGKKPAKKAMGEAFGSFDKIALGVETVMDQVDSSGLARGEVDFSDPGGTYEKVKDLAETAKTQGQTIKDQYGALTSLFKEVSDNPILYLKSMGAIAANYAGSRLKTFVIGSIMARDLTLKYMGGRDQADALLRKWNVENGADGLDFSCSSIFDSEGDSANPAEDVNIVILYRMSVAPLLGRTFQQTFCITASARGWLGGDTSIDRLSPVNPENYDPASEGNGDKTNPEEDAEEDDENEDNDNEDGEEEQERIPWDSAEAQRRHARSAAGIYYRDRYNDTHLFMHYDQNTGEVKGLRWITAMGDERLLYGDGQGGKDYYVVGDGTFVYAMEVEVSAQEMQCRNVCGYLWSQVNQVYSANHPAQERNIHRMDAAGRDEERTVKLNGSEHISIDVYLPPDYEREGSPFSDTMVANYKTVIAQSYGYQLGTEEFARFYTNLDINFINDDPPKEDD